jgi:hypothetical protein
MMFRRRCYAPLPSARGKADGHAKLDTRSGCPRLARYPTQPQPVARNATAGLGRSYWFPHSALIRVHGEIGAVVIVVVLEMAAIVTPNRGCSSSMARTLNKSPIIIL